MQGRLGALRRAVRVVAAALLGLGVAAAADAARVASVSPLGEVAAVRQVVVRFSDAVVAAGNPLAPAPFTLACQGNVPRGDARWSSERAWVFDLAEPLAAGARCTLSAAPGWRSLDGSTLDGPREYGFATGAPVVLSVEPYAGARIDEDQHFLLALNGAVDAASVQRAAWCEVEGLADRIGVTIVDGAARTAVLGRRGREASGATQLLLACQRPFAPDGRVRLVWGAGIAGVAAAGQPPLVSRREQRFEWRVRERFSAEFTCERERAGAPCMPLRAFVLRFNAPVPRSQALAIRLLPEQGTPIAPAVRAASQGAGTDDMLAEVRFAAPLPEHTRFRITLPANLRDDAGRALANAASFPLAVASGAMPPLAKFAGAPFGIVEAGSAADPALLPLTLRHVQAELADAATGGQVSIKHLDAATPDAELLRWMARLRADHDAQYKTRSAPLLATEPGVRRTGLPQIGAAAPAAQVSGRPASAGSAASAAPSAAAAAAPAPTEVIGIPLPQRGLHIVEIESRVLGNALLAARAPLYARTAALVTNVAVHFKHGRSSSLAWVTTLDRGRPVAGARVAVNDCNGRQLWAGTTDAAGIARIERGFETPAFNACLSHEGLFVSARSGDDVSFVFSGWTQGIEAWRFAIPQARGAVADRRAHTVFDRTLLRAGESVAMKHFVRDDTERGLSFAAAATLPNALLLTHVGSGNEVRLPLAWPRGARAAESSWPIPKSAALGLYDVALLRGEQRLASGSFRVEAYRVPLVDARLAAPKGVLVAPAELAFAAQLNALAGGPMVGAPLRLSAMLRRKPVQFAGYDEFSFEPAGNRAAQDDSDDGARLVADKLAARTDRQGAATIVAQGLPALQGPSELLAELTFSDPNGEVQTVAQRLALWPAALVVGLRVPGWTATRGDAGATAVVLSTDGKPLVGRTLEVSGRLHQTFSTRKRIVGGFYAYDNRRETRELGTLCSGTSDAQGRVACAIKLEQTGEVELIARARDDAGRVSEAASSAWVSGRDEWWFGQDNDDRIDVLPEQREVQPGQTARLQVRMPFRQATALVTVEREGVIDARVMPLSGREPVIEIPIPKAATAGARSWAPNVVVSVLVLRGRLRDAPWWSLFSWGWREPAEWWRAFRYEGRDYRAPTGLVDLAKPAFKLGVAQLVVGLADHRLDVAVQTDKPQYGVRETVKATVRVTQHGKPLAGAEIAFAAVDEGLLALQPNTSWDLLGGLLQPRPWGVETATAQGEIVGRRHYGRKALPPGGGGGRNPTRELFDTLLLWRGTVQLDADGTARIDVPLNDSLTSFRLVAIADAGAERFGSGSASVRVTQDLQLLSGLPPLVRDGDRFDAAFTLRNTTQRALTVKAVLTGTPRGAVTRAVIAPAPQTVTLAAGAAAELRWPVQVPAGAERIEWEAGVEAAADAGNAALRDRVKITQTVLPVVPQRVWQATLAQLGSSTALALAPPADALPGATLVATLQPRLSGALPGLRRYFETYPYNCIEQQASRAIALHDSARWAAVQGDVAAYLDSDGLAGYFIAPAGSAPRGSDKLTAYLIAAAHEAGLAWPEQQRQAMLQGLAAFVEGRIERRFASPRTDLDVRKLAALEALARHGRVQPRMLGSLAWTPAAWPTSALLDAWSLYRRVDTLPERAARSVELQRLLRSRLIAGGTTLQFTTEASDDWWWLMEGPDANAARLLLAAADSPAWRDDMPLLVRGTLARQRRGAWSTTTANLWGVLALERFAANFEATAVAGRSTLQLAGATRVHDWAAAASGAALTLPWPAGGSSLQARHEGSGRPWLGVQLLAAVPLQQPLAAGYRLTRQVSAVQRQLPDAWSRGDTLRVRIEIDAASDMSWVVLSDPVPAGAALLGSGLARDSVIAAQAPAASGAASAAEARSAPFAVEPVFIERSFEAWRGYFEWLPRGRHVVEYTLRLNTSGRFALPPTRAEAMYAPETFGELPNAALEVRP